MKTISQLILLFTTLYGLPRVPAKSTVSFAKKVQYTPSNKFGENPSESSIHVNTTTSSIPPTQNGTITFSVNNIPSNVPTTQSSTIAFNVDNSSSTIPATQDDTYLSNMDISLSVTIPYPKDPTMENSGGFGNLLIDSSVGIDEKGHLHLYCVPNATPDAISVPLTVDQLALLWECQNIFWYTCLSGGVLCASVIFFIVFKCTTKKPENIQTASTNYKVVSFFAMYLPIVFVLCVFENLLNLSIFLSNPAAKEVVMIMVRAREHFILWNRYS